MGQCLSTLTDDGPAVQRYKSTWQPPGLGEGLGAGGIAFAGPMGAPAPPAAPAYTTTANVGLGRGEERRVFLHDPAPGGLPRIEEDQTMQGQESPPKTQLSSVSTQSNCSPASQPQNWTRGELIGQGAFGSVYLGMDNDTGQLMAVKQVNISKAAERGGKAAEHIKGLEAEVHLLQQLNHANIVRYLGTERTDAALNIFLEYVPGGSIASLLAKFGSFRESVIKVYTKQILLGLEYLHKNGIMHRDIKGANILVDNTGLVKLADFGASKKIEDLVTIESGFKSVKGTPYWMAPEVIKQSGHGRQADIWSVACTVIEMATGKPPWSEFGSQVAAMFHIASSKSPPTIPETLSADCKDFLYLCFNRSWKDRPSATRLLQHPFLAEVVCRTVAAPLNNIANMVHEPSIKAWRLPKNVRVPSPMREESEGAPFSTPSPMHPRVKEAAAGAAAVGGGARISTATSHGAPTDGEQTPGSELPLSPLGGHLGAGRRPQQQESSGVPPATAGPATSRHQQPQQRGSPTKSRMSVRSSAPVFGGYASVALTPRAPLERRAGPSLGNSAASSVQPRVAVGDSQQQQPTGRLSRESSLGVDATLRGSNGSLRLSREPSAAGPPAQPRLLGTEPAPAGGPPLALRPLEVPEASPQETPAPGRRGAQDLIEFPDSVGRPAARAGQEASTPSTGDSRGTFKSDYNPMEEPSWMQQAESPLEAAPSAAETHSPSPVPARLATQLEPSAAAQELSRASSVAAPPTAQPQEPSPEQQQQHMVWMDDDGSIDALPWDTLGGWSVGSGETSPSGGAPGAPPLPELQPQPSGEPVGQDVLITALNRRAQQEVRASLALFESTLRSLNVPKGGLKEATPSPRGAKPAAPMATKPAVPQAVQGPLQQAAAVQQQQQQQHASLGAVGASMALPGVAKLPMARACKEDQAAGLGQPAHLPAAAAAYQSVHSIAEDVSYGGREAVWEQELSKELSQFGQLPSQWRYAGGRRQSMHGSPQKPALQQREAY